MGAYPPTEEMQAILDADRVSPVLLVDGRAGAAKTTTLQHIARQRGTPGFYMVFSKSMSLEARRRFPSFVTVKTAHSVAWSAMGMGRAKGKLARKVYPEDVSRHFVLPSIGLSLDVVGQIVLSSVDRFCNSGDGVLSEDHVLAADLLAEEHVFAVGALVEVAREVFARMASFDDDFPMRHDVYLKLWQLAGAPMPPGIEWILFDEAQDANGVQIAAMLNQSVPVTWVGDPHQSIFRFRGAVNAMREIARGDDRPVMSLTRSFRFGQQIADLANAVLWCKPRETRPERFLTGRDDLESSVGPLPAGVPHTFLARSNAGCFREADRAPGSVHMVGGIDHVVRLLRSAWTLWSGGARGDLVPEIARFASWAVLRQVADVTRDPELISVRNLVEEYQHRLPRRLDAFVARHVSTEDQADLVVSTFHKSKGREWDYVRISDAALWHPEQERWFELSSAEREDEINLFYVAVTRARLALDIPEVALSYVRMAKLAGWSGTRFVGVLASAGVEPAVEAGSEVVVSPPCPESAPSGSIAVEVEPSGPSLVEAPTDGPLTEWQIGQIEAASRKGVSVVQISRIVRRNPDVVRLAVLVCGGASADAVGDEMVRIRRRFGDASAVARQAGQVAGQISAHVGP